MTDLVFRWLPPGERSYFRLSPFELATPPPSPRVAGRLGRVLLSAWAGEGVTARLGRSTTDAETRRRALELAELTGDPVVVGEVDTLDGEAGEPVYRSVGLVTLAKVRDPLSPEAWLQEVSRLSARLGVVAETEAAHLAAEALEWFRFDFADATGSQIATATGGLRGTIAAPRGTMIAAQRLAISRSLRAVIAQTGAATARLPSMRPTLGAAFNLPDRRIAEAMAAHHGFWVRDQYGRVSQSLARQAQPIIQQGIANGLGRVAIGRELQETIRGGLGMKNYWRIVAANHITRARSYATGYTMRAAGIEFFKWESVIDEATTEECLMLHDRVFSVSGAMAIQDRLLADPDPDGVLWNQPFARHDGDDIYVETPDGRRTVLGTVVERGAGTGSPGVYSGVLSGSQMLSGPVSLPPIHHACRSTVISV